MHSVGRAAAYSVAFASRALSSRLSKRSALSGVLFVLNPLSPLRDPILDLARQGHCNAASEDISKQRVTWNRKGWEPPPFLSSFWELRLSGHPPKRRKGSHAVQPRCTLQVGYGSPLGICWATALDLASTSLNPLLPASFSKTESDERAARLSPPNSAISPCASRASNCSPGIPSLLASEATESNSFFPAASLPARICKRPEVMAMASLTFGSWGLSCPMRSNSFLASVSRSKSSRADATRFRAAASRSFIPSALNSSAACRASTSASTALLACNRRPPRQNRPKATVDLSPI